MNNPRILSLLPAATEIICLLGFREHLVGVSHECDYPSSVGDLPVCTLAGIKSGSSRQIHDSLADLLRNALAVYSVKTDVLAELAPTHIVTQDQCDVCSVSRKDVEDAAARFLTTSPCIISLAPSKLADIYSDIQRVAECLGEARRAENVLTPLLVRQREVEARAHEAEKQPTVACLEWLDPLMASGNWVPEMVAMAGGRCIFGEVGVHSPWINWTEVVRADPEIILVKPCGFDLGRAVSETRLLTEKPGWQNLRAVKNKRVYVVDGHQYFNRPGPRIIDSLEILGEMLHPDLFDYGFRDKDWVVYPV
ncbi:MAG: cobalamin-binding protein [Acidobacteriota bacterium]|nr:cobalamin-binding protein [Acidobacteriota bacterium]